jgi:ATP diphosphatase
MPSHRKKRARAVSAATRARKAGEAFARLVRVMHHLRSPEGCPWDRRQTVSSLRPFLLEETYEALEANDRGDWDALPGELGDVLFQCVFQSQIAAEEGRFDIADALGAITAKLIRRHPHVFFPSGRPLSRAARTRLRLGTADAVVQQWEQIKTVERAGSPRAGGVLDGVPRSLPALLGAHEIGTRVAAVGFDWDQSGDVIDKMEEEVRELRDALSESPARAAEELGDLLFSIANLARRLQIEPEAALRAANHKFASRFAAVEADLRAAGRSVHDASRGELEAAWVRVKAAGAATARPSSAPRRRRARRSSRRQSRA